MDLGTVFRLQPAPDLSLALTSGGPRVRFAGQRGRTYEIQHAPAITGPWNIIATLVAPPDNTIEYTDTDAPTPWASTACAALPSVP